VIRVQEVIVLFAFCGLKDDVIGYSIQFNIDKYLHLYYQQQYLLQHYKTVTIVFQVIYYYISHFVIILTSSIQLHVIVYNTFECTLNCKNAF